jgi:hypothetical protein
MRHKAWTTNVPWVPINAMSAPPIAGPITRMAFPPRALRATAFVISSGPAVSKTSRLRIGPASASTMPAAAAKK